MANVTEIISGMLIDSSVKSVVIFVALILVLLVLRMRHTDHSQVHAAHRVWVFLIASMLLIPILSFALPGLSVPMPFLKSELAASSQATDEFVGSAQIGRIDAVSEDVDKGLTHGTDVSEMYGNADPMLGIDVALQDTSSTLAAMDTFRSDPNNDNSSLLPPGSSRAITWDWPAIFTLVWAAVCMVLFSKMVIVKLWTSRLLHRATAISLIEDVGGAKTVQSIEVGSPAVSGLFSHTIVLPAHWREWSDEKRTAVLAHELAHIHRRDGLVVFLAQINTALFWFNPIAWIASSKVSRLAELACDQSAVLETGDRVGYAQQLLEIAATKMGHSFQPGIAMAAPSGISERIEMLLDTTRPFTRKASRVFIAALLMIGVPTLMVIAAAQPGDEDQRTGAEKAAEDWIRTESGKTILTFRGEIVDEDGNPAVNPKVQAKSLDWLDVKVNKNEFECDVILENRHMPGLRVVVESEDGKLASVFQIYSHDMRASASKFHKISLKSTRSYDFKVLDEGNPVSGTNVKAKSTSWFVSQGTTNKQGIVTLHFPHASALTEVLAWHDDGRIGGYSFDRDPVRDPKQPVHEIQLSACVDQKIRLVDSEGSPLVGFKFDSYVATKKPGINFLPRDLTEGMRELVTDENGEAIDRWFPDWESVHFYPELAREFEYGQGWSKAGDGKPKLVDGVFVSEFEQPPTLQRLPFKGKVNFPDGVKGGMQIRLASFQHPEEGRYDPITCRTDIEGNFFADVIPGATYAVNVNDPEWVSSTWSGILAGPGSGKNSMPNIEIFKGESVSIKVTVGPDKKPLANQVISLHSRDSFEWKEDGETQYGRASVSKWLTTNADGIAIGMLRPGKCEASIYNPGWRPSQAFTLVENESKNIEFHRASPGKRLLSGKLTMPKGTKVDLSGTVVELRAVDGETKSQATVTTDAAGNFSAEMDGARIGGFARTPDGKFTATFFLGDPEDGLNATLTPAIVYRGKFIDGNDQPVKNKQVKMRVILKEKDPDWSKTNFVSSQFEVDLLHAETDGAGQFEFTAPASTPLRLSVLARTPSPEDDGFKSAGEKFLVANENRPLEVMRLGRKSIPQLSMEQTVAWKVNDCRLNHTRHLFVLEGEGDSVTEFLQTALNEDTEEGRSLYSYSVTRITPSEWTEPEARKFWEKYQVNLPKENEVAFLVLGHEAELVSSVTLAATQADSITKSIEFVKVNRVETIDAQKTLDEALALAKSSDRKVWLQYSQTRCGPCFRLSRWIDKHKEVLEKAYVFIKVDDVRDDNGREIWKRYVGERSMGIPFCVVLDAEGKVLEESVDQQKSNIGFPSTFEDGRAFRRIFDATADKLSKEEINALIETIFN